MYCQTCGSDKVEEKQFLTFSYWYCDPCADERAVGAEPPVTVTAKDVEYTGSPGGIGLDAADALRYSLKPVAEEYHKSKNCPAIGKTSKTHPNMTMAFPIYKDRLPNQVRTRGNLYDFISAFFGTYFDKATSSPDGKKTLSPDGKGFLETIKLTDGVDEQVFLKFIEYLEARIPVTSKITNTKVLVRDQNLYVTMFSFCLC